MKLYFRGTGDQASFPGGSVIKNPPVNAGEVGLIPGLGRFPQRRKWQPTPVFLPGKSHGQRTLASYSPQGHKESDTERLNNDKQIIQLRSNCSFFNLHLPSQESNRGNILKPQQLLHFGETSKERVRQCSLNDLYANRWGSEISKRTEEIQRLILTSSPLICPQASCHKMP